MVGKTTHGLVTTFYTYLHPTPWCLAWFLAGLVLGAIAVIQGAVWHGGFHAVRYGTAAIGKSSTTVFGATMTDICRPVDEAKTIAPGLGINRLVG
jgi:hypothetical protein